MRFILTEEFWGLDALTPGEWQLVSDLPGAAAGHNLPEKAKKRLFPSPFAPNALLDDQTSTQLEDWKQFVEPELKTGFEQAREVVSKDLEAVTTIEAHEVFESEPDELPPGLPELRRLQVPIEHTEDWYSVLNQARILMNEVHDLADSEDRLLLQINQEEELDEDRILLLAQYELYSIVQNILVENIMSL